MAEHTSPRHKLGKPAGDNAVILGLGAQFAERRRELGILQQQLADAAHQVCPYSNATRGNIEVTVNVVED